MHLSMYLSIHPSIHSLSHETRIDLLPLPGNGDIEAGTAWFLHSGSSNWSKRNIFRKREMGADVVFRKYVSQSTVGANGSQFPDGRIKAVCKNQRKSDCISEDRANFPTIREAPHWRYKAVISFQQTDPRRSPSRPQGNDLLLWEDGLDSP